LAVQSREFFKNRFALFLQACPIQKYFVGHSLIEDILKEEFGCEMSEQLPLSPLAKLGNAYIRSRP